MPAILDPKELERILVNPCEYCHAPVGISCGSHKKMVNTTYVHPPRKYAQPPAPDDESSIW